MAAGTLPAVIGGANKNTLVIYDANANVAASVSLLNSSGVEIFTAANPGIVADINNAAFRDAYAIAPGSTVAAGQSIGFICTASGNITLTLAAGSTLTLPITANAQLFQILPFAVTQITLGSGTAGTFWGLR